MAIPSKQRVQARRDAQKPKENVKHAEYNLAKMGAKKDLIGIRYNQHKSVIKAVNDRKRSASIVNQSEGIQQSDVVTGAAIVG